MAFLKHCNNRAGLSIATLPSFLPTFKFEQGWYPCVTFTPLTAIHPTLYQLVYGGLAELIFYAAIYLTMAVSNQKALATLATAHV